MLELYSADGCPYAQRSRALLALRNVPYELHTIDLANKPKAFLDLSPTGRVPMLLDEGRVLYESYVIGEYLREKTGWQEGLSGDFFQRARERLAMLQFDNVVLPALWQALRAKGALEEARRRTLERELDELERTQAAADARVNLLALHVVTHVVRFRWLGDLTPAPELLRARPALEAWLAEIAALPAVRSTLPDEAATVATMRRMAGLAEGE